MIVTGTVTIQGKEYTRTYSDKGCYIQAEDGALYAEAVDPAGSDRSYAETTELAEDDEVTASEALSIIIGSEVSANDT